MAVEDRVKAIEDELAILKDQIRNTLLEIQEQILIHYYPDLRAKESPPSEAAMAALRSSAAASREAKFAGLQRVRLDEGEPAPFTDLGSDELAPAAPEVPALTNLQTTVTPAKAEPVQPRDALASLLNAGGETPQEAYGATDAFVAPAEAKESTDRATVTRLMEWASDAVDRIGKERTGRAVTIYGDNGYLSANVKETLKGFIALADDDTHVERVSLRTILDVVQKLNEVLEVETAISAANWLMEETKLG